MQTQHDSGLARLQYRDLVETEGSNGRPAHGCQASQDHSIRQPLAHHRREARATRHGLRSCGEEMPIPSWSADGRSHTPASSADPTRILYELEWCQAMHVRILQDTVALVVHILTFG